MACQLKTFDDRRVVLGELRVDDEALQDDALLDGVTLRGQVFVFVLLLFVLVTLRGQVMDGDGRIHPLLPLHAGNGILEHGPNIERVHGHVRISWLVFVGDGRADLPGRDLTSRLKVELIVDIERGPETCGNGKSSSPSFKVDFAEEVQSHLRERRGSA